MRICPHCGQSITSDTAQFCGSCGQKLTDPVTDAHPALPKASISLCRACGAPLHENSLFCGACGTSADKNDPEVPSARPLIQPEAPESSLKPARAESASKKPRNRFSFRRLYRKAVMMLFIAALLYAGGLFLLSQEHKLGLWEKFTFQRTMDAWKKDKAALAQEKPLLEAITALADKLDAGDLEGAMYYVSPARQEAFRQDLTALSQDPAARTALAAALRQSTVTFIGSADGNPEEAPFRAQVSIPVDKLTHTITCVMMNERWVVTRL